MSMTSNLSLFVPDIDALDLQGILSFTPDGVTNLVIILISFIFLCASLWGILSSVWYFFKNRSLKRTIKGLPDDEKPEVSASRHTAFKTYAEACTSFDGCTYCPPAAEEFFNDETLASGIVRNRLLNLMPTILTGLGVLGTFVGLTIGLRGFDLSGSSAQVNSQIANMTACASTAFVTSVWGVASSLLLNVILKILSALLSWQIRSIQSLIETKFPPGSPVEAFMKDLSENLRGSKDALDLLAEKIGNSIQESTQSITNALATQTAQAEIRQEAMFAGLTERSAAMAETMATRIGDAIKGSIGDAILHSVQQVMAESAENMRRTSEELKAILQDFSQNTGNAGEAQSAAVLTAVQNLQKAVETSTSESSRLFEKLSRQQEEFSQGLNTRNDGLLNELRAVMANQQEAVSQMLASSSAMTGHTEETLNTLLGKQQGVMSDVDRVLKANTASSDAMLDEVQKVLSAFAGNVDEMRGLSADMDKLCTQIRSASLSMEKMGAGIDATMKQVSSSVDSSVTAAGRLVEEGRRVGEGFTSAASSLDNTRTALDKASASFVETAEGTATQYSNLASSYDRLQHTVDNQVREMNEQVKSIMENYNAQVESMMKSYAHQVVEQTAKRLGEWDKGTKDFCDRLVQVVMAMGEAVDEQSNRRR